MNTLGIDLGLTGALVFLEGQSSITSWAMPRVGPQFSAVALDGIFSAVGNAPGLVVVCEEAQHIRIPARIHKGKPIASTINPKSTSVLFENQGLIKALCAAHRLRLELVAPKVWQAVMLRSTGTGNTKDRALIAAQRLWPGTTLKRAHIDAALIAEYGRRLAAGATLPAAP